MTTSTSRAVSAGPTSRPVSEKVSGDDPPSGRKQLAGALGSHSPSGDHTNAKSTDTARLVDVVRASCRIRIDAAHLIDDKQGRRDHYKRRCGGRSSCEACALIAALHETQRAAVRAANVALRAYWRLDSDLVDRYLLEHQRPPKGREWREPRASADIVRAIAPGLGGALLKEASSKLVNSKGALYVYPLIRAVAPELPSGVASALARYVDQRWRQDRFDALVRNIKRPTHFRDTLPLPLRAQDVDISRKERQQYIVRLSIGGRRWALPVVGKDPYLAKLYRELVNGAAKLGQIKVERDIRRPGVWYMRIAYTRQVQRVAPNERYCAVTLGIVTILSALGYDGDRWMQDGAEIEAYLRQIQRRRKDYQRGRRGSNRYGHGTRKALQPTEILAGKAERWRADKVQTFARRLALWIHDRGYTHVYIANFSGVRDGVPEQLIGGKSVWDRIHTWPFYSMQLALTSCLEELGIDVTEMDPRRPHECPACFEEKGQLYLKQRRFKCTGCGHSEHLDIARARRILTRAADLRAQADGSASDAGVARKAPAKKNGRATRKKK